VFEQPGSKRSEIYRPGDVELTFDTINNEGMLVEEAIDKKKAMEKEEEEERIFLAVPCRKGVLGGDGYGLECGWSEWVNVEDAPDKGGGRKWPTNHGLGMRSFPARKMLLTRWDFFR
jgi:hypothetical protein